MLRVSRTNFQSVVYFNWIFWHLFAPPLSVNPVRLMAHRRSHRISLSFIQFNPEIRINFGAAQSTLARSESTFDISIIPQSSHSEKKRMCIVDERKRFAGKEHSKVDEMNIINKFVSHLPHRRLSSSRTRNWNICSFFHKCLSRNMTSAQQDLMRSTRDWIFIGLQHCHRNALLFSQAHCALFRSNFSSNSHYQLGWVRVLTLIKSIFASFTGY